MIQLFFGLLVTLSPGSRGVIPPPATVPAKTSAHELLEDLDVGPPIERVQQAAIMQMHISPRQTAKWLRRVRAAAIAPEIRAQVTFSDDRGWELGQEAGAADELSEDQGSGRALQVRATWHLDRLIFDVSELRVAQTGLDVQAARRRLLAEVTGLYFERIEQLLALHQGSLTPEKQVATWLELQRVTALLEALTGLDFPDSTPPPTRAR